MDCTSASLAAEPPPETTRTQAGSVSEHLHGALVYGGRSLARRGIHRRAVCGGNGGRPDCEGNRLRRSRCRRWLRRALRRRAGQGTRLSSWPASTSAASSCSEPTGFARPRPQREDHCRAGLGPGAAFFRGQMVAHVGLDPRKDINFVAHPAAEAKRASRRGKDRWASMGFPPDPRSCERRKSAMWSLIARWTGLGPNTFAAWSPETANSSRKNPAATKRALRAILKGDRDLRSRARARRPDFIVDKGYHRRATSTRSKP